MKRMTQFLVLFVLLGLSTLNANPLPIPTASWPVGNPTIYTNPPTLNWYLGALATGLTYEIQCVPASDPWLADNVFATSSTLYYTFNSGLTAGVKYAWRVRSTDGVTKSAWSNTAEFTMVNNTGNGPVIPTASWPVGNPTIYTNPPTLNWYLGALATGLTYEIQCVPASDPWLADIVFATSSELSYTFNSGLTAGVKYAWRVRSTDGILKSAWSNTAEFTMAANNSPVQPITGSPTDFVTIHTNSPQLFWYLPTAAPEQQYELSYSTSSDMTNPIIISDIHSLNYQLENLNANATYYWVVRSKKSDGSKSIASQKGAFNIGAVTNIQDSKITDIPEKYSLRQNYPNPFNPSTTISYSLPFESKVSIKIYNVLGQVVRTLKDEILPAGNHEVQFNSSNLTSGVYFYRLTAESPNGEEKYSAIMKMILLK